MTILQKSRFRFISCLIWCLSWPAIAIALLMPLPINFAVRSDLLAHFLLFAVMAASVIAFSRRRRQVILLAVLSITNGVALELAQAYVPGRTFDAADAIANIIGGIAGCLGALAVLECWFAVTEARQSRS